MQHNALKYLKLAEKWLHTRRTEGLSSDRESAFEAQLEGLWNRLSDHEQEWIETILNVRHGCSAFH